MIGSTSLNSFSTRKYLKCHDFGHIATNYPNQWVISFTEQRVIDEYEEEEAETNVNNDELQLLADGELLVGGRILQT